MRELYELIGSLSDSLVSVVVEGETGTGKEVIARALHSNSQVRNGPFLALSCAAMPAALLESELFGHVREASTDAKAAKNGLLLEANGGTLLLDEIGDLPLELQPKLLRALQERKLRPLGGSEDVAFDCRIIAATDRNLEEDVREKRFREDLYYRLNVVRITVPPLRERGDDILLLARHFLRRFAKRRSRSITFTESAQERLRVYAWPGNVRELENCIESAVALSRNDPETMSSASTTFPTRFAFPKSAANGHRRPCRCPTWYRLPSSSTATFYESSGFPVGTRRERPAFWASTAAPCDGISSRPRKPLRGTISRRSRGARDAPELDPRFRAVAALRLTRRGLARLWRRPPASSRQVVHRAVGAPRTRRLNGTLRAVVRLVVSFNGAFRSNQELGIPWERLGLRMLAESRFAAEDSGGDFHVFALRDRRRLAVVVGDACGHGPSAARLLPCIVPSIRTLLHSEATPSRLLTEVNRLAARNLPMDRFVTCAAFELDLRASRLTASSAGHVPALVRRANGEVVVVGRGSGPPLGIVPDCTYADEYHHLDAGDVVVFMTDGVLEAIETDLLEMVTLRELLGRKPAERGALHRSLVRLLDGCSAARSADDMTLVSLELVQGFRPSVSRQRGLAVCP
jgi:MoxR-like ATPase